MSTKSNPGLFDCYAKALPNEPMFVLLARDETAPDYVRMWAAERTAEIAKSNRPVEDMHMVIEALDCARDMEKWRDANEGAWRVKAEPETANIFVAETVKERVPEAVALERIACLIKDKILNKPITTYEVADVLHAVFRLASGDIVR
jgi:hypothetical protein